MCAIVFYSKVDNLVISGLEVNGTFLHNFKGYKTLQRSFVINKEEYKEFQDNTGPCNIKELVIHTNKGIFIERKIKSAVKINRTFSFLNIIRHVLACLVFQIHQNN